MTKHLSQQIIDSFAARTLEPRDVLAAAQHIAACEACRRQLDQVRPMDTRAWRLHADLQGARSTSPLHPDYDEMESYVDGKLRQPEREAVSTHLSICAACAEEAQELELLRDNLATYPNTEAETTATSARESWRQRLFIFLPFGQQRLGWAIIVNVLIISVGGLLLWRQQQQSRPPQLVVLPRPELNAAVHAPGNMATPGIAESEAVGDSSSSSSNSSPPPVAIPPQDSDNSSPPAPAEQRPPRPYRSGVFRSDEVVTGESLLSDYEGVIRRALISQRVAAPAAFRELDSRRSTLMSGANEGTGITLLTPVGTVVRTNRPHFRWLPSDGVTSYQVVILDSNFNVIAESGPLSVMTWRPSRTLDRGNVYLWQVTARQGDREITSSAASAREARFKILSQAEERKLRRLAPVTSHIELGLIYAHHGLFDEAESELRASLKENRQTATAKKLIESLKGLRQ